MYCVYLTIYKGNKLPMFYIGSSSLSKINNGYRGSVSSKEYKQRWLSESKLNPQLFKTKIIAKFETRNDATKYEYKIHKALKVVESELYINMANAVPDGIFGGDVSGKNNPVYGKKRPDSSKTMKNKNPMMNQNIAQKVTETKKILRSQGKHKSCKNKTETLVASSKRMKLPNPSKIMCSCVYCKKTTNISAITRFHSKCKEQNVND